MVSGGTFAGFLGDLLKGFWGNFCRVFGVHFVGFLGELLQVFW